MGCGVKLYIRRNQNIISNLYFLSCKIDDSESLSFLYSDHVAANDTLAIIVWLLFSYVEKSVTVQVTSCFDYTFSSCLSPDSGSPYFIAFQKIVE